jgi:thiol-disulfide isomerase/thioredoxin
MRTKSSPSTWAILVALALLGGTVAAPDAQAAPGNEPNAPRRGGRVTVGAVPPPLNLDRIAGNEAVTLEGLAGRVVVLDFWATWCSPCRAVMPALDDLYRRHRAQGLSVVGLSPESDATIRRHVAALPVDYTIARDLGGTMEGYGVRAIPTLVVLDRAGQVREVMVGVDPASIARLEALVQQLLAQPAPSNRRR